MTLQRWYRQIFANGDRLYFYAVKVLKNGHIQGKSYMLYTDKPRSRAKGKQCSVYAPELWTMLVTAEVPLDRFAP